MPGTRRAAAPRIGSPSVSPTTVEGWLRELGLEPTATVEREGITAWDMALDGRRRRDLRATLILDPAVGAIVWAHLAPPLGDGLRKAYRSLLRWNDEFPLAKFSVADDGRPILAVEIPNRWLGADELGLALARVAESLLYGVTPSDPETFGAVVILLAAVALAAGWIPSRRATRIDPLAALRED